MNRPAMALMAVCFALVSTPGAVHAQARYRIETRAGFGFSEFSGDGAGDAESKTGMALAIAFGIPLNERVSLQPEIAYAMKGASYGEVTDPTIDGVTYGGTFEILYAVDYIELPVLLRAQLMNGPVRPVIEAGPVLGWKVVEKLHLNGEGSNDPYGKGDALRALDLAATGGVGFELGPMNRCITLGFRYTQGFSDVQKPQYDGTIRNSDFRVQLGWRQNWSTMLEP